MAGPSKEFPEAANNSDYPRRVASELLSFHSWNAGAWLARSVLDE